MASTSNGCPVKIVDPLLELLDPIPNIHELFIEYDALFFKKVLNNHGVEVRWSPRMTLCAGICVYEGRGGLCSVRLSVPLLKFRPRKDIVETLLHEMIHAYLFVTQNNRDHDGHGPQFQSHMKRINKTTGTNITIYHSFHNEVAQCRQHWWRCSGRCRFKPPYHGFVKRATNRAPSKHDPWWTAHQRSCGGIFVKVKEPDGYKNKKSIKKKQYNKVMTPSCAQSPSMKPMSSLIVSNGVLTHSKVPKAGRDLFPGQGYSLGKASEPLFGEVKVESDLCVNRPINKVCQGFDDQTYIHDDEPSKTAKGKQKRKVTDLSDFLVKRSRASNEKSIDITSVSPKEMTIDKLKLNLEESGPKMEESVYQGESISIIDLTHEKDQGCGSLVVCPCCQKEIRLEVMNNHLDICVS